MKNQFKKSLSLVMAVLMILSCWVWIAPEKAEAAGGTTSYFIRMKYNVHDNWDNSAGKYKVYIDYKSLNGTGSSGTHTVTPGEKWCAGEGEQWIVGTAEQSVKIDGFPYQVRVWGNPSGGRTYGWNNGVLEVSGDGTTWKTLISGMSYQVTNSLIDSDDKNVNATLTLGSVSSSNANYPKLTSVEGAASQELTLGELGSATNVSVTPTLSAGKDQYGVSWEADFPTKDWKHKMALDGNGTTTGLSTSNISVSGTTNEPTITAKPATQLLKKNPSNGKVIYYLLSTYGSSTATTQVIVNYPTYTATFDANGGKIGDSDSDVKDKIEVTSTKMYYGAVIGKMPAYRTKDGFDFAGFYSSPNADATGLAASFSGTLFEDNVTTIPDDGDVTYYAAWKAKTITATFLTADNQLIGTVEGRYNNYLTASNMYNGDAGLNATVKRAYDSAKADAVDNNKSYANISFDLNNNPIYKDGSTTYTFAGWKIIKAYDESVMDKNEDTVLKGDVTFQATYTKADAEKYTVSFEDGNGGQLSSKDDYNYRDAVTNVPVQEPTKATDDKYEYSFIGWAKKLEGVKFFAVDENNCDEDGATIVYTSKDAAEFIVKGNATYIPVFRMTAREYDVTFKYMVDGGTETTLKVSGYHWGDTITVPDSIKNNYTANGFRYYIESWNGPATVNSAAPVLTAVYGAGVGAEYAINFYGKDTDGVTDKLISEGTYVHGSTVTAPEVAQTIDTEDALYTFAGWSPAVNTTAGGDVDYYATYTKKTYADIHFYNYDGTLIYELDGKENGLFVDELIPEYSNLVEKEDEEGVFENVLPSKAEDVVGTYNFTGWKDGDGNVVVPGTDKFAGDLYLTAQFETVYKEYTVKFVNEGNTVSETEYHYGEEITVPNNPTKEADVAYVYDFRAWSPDVSEVCYGDATYTATYRRTPQYYKVIWFNDTKKTVHTESNYQYNAKIQQATINAPVSYDPAGAGKTWAFKHWVQCDANGNDILDDNGEQVLFVRGQRMGSEHLYFYPVFEKADNVLTVTFYEEDGTSFLGEAKIPYGREISEYDEAFKAMAPKAADETNHYVINNWVNVNGGADVTTITADVSVKATYTAYEHTKDVYDITIEPTCTETGLANVSCSEDACDKTFYNVILDVIPDEAAPTGQIYVGTNKWTLENYVGGIDYNDIKYVSPSTNVIVNADDLGSRSRNNPEGTMSRGVGKIDYYISETKVDDPSSIATWTNVYDFGATENQVLNEVLTVKGKTMQDYIAMSNKEKKAIDDEVKAILATYKANATGILSNLNLVNGKNYIIYIRVSDREVGDQSNKCYFSSGTISYGSTAPSISVSGDGYGTKFCAEATVSVTDDTSGVTVYLDENVVSLDANGKFVCDTKGVHTVTAVDIHGNKTVKTFEIKGGHTYRNYVIGATCENAGSRYDICTVCGAKANVTEIPALGHSYTENYIDKAADCINDGYRTYICDNNCGTKLVLKPTDDVATIAQAKKKVEPAEGEEEGTWVALTAADLSHLKATGKHTYAKVKDEEGNDTAEDAWVVDKAATCSVEGSKHRDCTVCGIIGRETAVIPVDTENGHKFYREKVTLEPTCTETGKRTKTCRYCGETVLVETLPALGHEAGEYRIIKPATCDEVGSKILTCSRCSTAETPVDIGEPIKDENGNVTGFDGKEVEIKALGHAWKLEGVPFKAEDGKWYQKYVCGNDSTHTKNEELEDYVEPVAATVTFKNGEVEHKTISGYVGNTITVAQIGEEPTKAADATKTYTFSHWATKNADGTYTEVKFPIEVKGDATYYAVYSERFVNYTITYYKEDGTTEFKKTGYLHNGEEVTLADGPAKAETTLVKYKFAGWVVNGSNPEVVYTDKVTIDGADINLVAKYKEIKKQYAVTYAYSKSNILETFAVEAGTAARECAIVPEKAADSKYHYNFKAWNKATQLANVESNIYTTPDFTPVSHTYDHEGGKVIKTAANCTDNAVYTYTCTCGYTYDKEEPNTALDHIWGDPVYDSATGKNTVSCQREGCDATEEDTRSFTVKFYVNADDSQPIKTVSYIPWGTTIAATRLPADPTKESTSTTDYTFKGWAIKGTTAAAGIDFSKLEIKQDYEFVAMFTETTREYTVIFAYNANNVIKTFEKVSAGSSVTYNGATPVKACDINYHYTFKGWKGYEAGVEQLTVSNVQSDLYILADFTDTKHTYSSYELKAATCTNGTGTRYFCDCNGNGEFDEKVNGAFVDYYYDVTGKPLEHNWREIKRVEATPNTDGYIDYECTVCGETKREVIKYVDNTIEIRVTVLHNGVAETGVKVELQNAADGSIKHATTNKNGVAVFTADKDGVYTAYVEKNGMNQVALTLENGAYVGTYSYDDAVNCTCACHRDNIWGAIFRFFHKIIKLFTGEFKCCGNPDPMYG